MLFTRADAVRRKIEEPFDSSPETRNRPPYSNPPT
ncbi:hypothetical protein ACVIQY_004357 [Bradyrhizobium sp. USDA 3051]